MPAPSSLTATSYAALGLLVARPRTTYELVEQMKRNLRFFWPGAQSRLYEEPKKLVAHGLATAEPGAVGRRPRTVYAITPKGRRALRRWLATPPAEPALAFEGLLRVLFAALGTREDLLAAIDSARPLADAIQRVGTVVAREYLEGRAPFPERIHLSGLTFDFLWGFAEHLRRWADASRAEVERWSDVAPDGKEAYARRIFARALASPTGRRLAPASPATVPPAQKAPAPPRARARSAASPPPRATDRTPAEGATAPPPRRRRR